MKMFWESYLVCITKNNFRVWRGRFKQWARNCSRNL